MKQPFKKQGQRHCALNRFLGSAADWVQHVIETEGEPYLHTPEDAIPLASLLLLDVFAFLLIAMLAPMGLAWVVGSRLLAHVRAPKAKTF